MTNQPQKLGAEYYRGFLSPQGQAFYDRINAQLLRGDYSGKTTLTFQNTKTAATDCFAAYKAIRDDHPEYFFLGYQSEFVRFGSSCTLTYPILYTPDIIARLRVQLRKSVESIVRPALHMTVLAKETWIYERIAKTLVYVNHHDVRDHNVVGPILTSAGVCEGHNALLMLCLRRVGIPCIKVYGRTDSDGYHCWTIAWIHNTPVHCDVTWDNAKSGHVRFNYLNLSDRQIGCDHFDFQGPSIPRCTVETLSYYHRHNLCVHSYHDLRARLKRAASTGTFPVLLHFDYRPANGDYMKELHHAISSVAIPGRHRFSVNPSLKNAVVEKG